MARLISFALTTAQFLDGSKTVTRRTGWRGLKPGTILEGVEKAMGLRPGEQVKRLGKIRVLDVRREPISACTDEDARREGFPHLTGAEFAAMFCEHMGCGPDAEVTRIEFTRIEKPDD